MRQTFNGVDWHNEEDATEGDLIEFVNILGDATSQDWLHFSFFSIRHPG